MNTVLSKPKIERFGERIRFTWEDEWVVVELDNIEEDHGDYKAEITIGNALQEQVIYEYGRINLSAMGTRASLGKDLKRDVNDTIDWTGMLKQVSLLGVSLFKEGEPSITLSEHEPSTKPRWYLEPYLEHDGFSIIYADGGTGKSVVAMAIAYAMATGDAVVGKTIAQQAPVLYLDWETSPDTQFRRLRAIATARGKAVPSTVHYQYMATPLITQAAQVRKRIASMKIGAVIIDSLGASASGPIEESNTALALGRAIRGFRVPVIAIHHKPKNTEGRRGAQVMFGSVYFANYCRLAWELAGTFHEEENRTDIGFANTKNNNGPRIRAHALTLQFINDINGNPVQIQLAPGAASLVEETNKTRSVFERASDLLRHEPMSNKELAEELDESVDTVSKAMRRAANDGRVLKIDESRWGLKVARNQWSVSEPPF